MSSRSYVTAASVIELRARLRPDDWAVLRDVAAMRVATALDLQALAALREELRVRQFRRRLQRLFELQVLDRLERRVGGPSAGSSGYIYALGVAGQRLLDQGERFSVRRPWSPRPLWLQHALASGQLYVVLRQAERDGRLTVVSYQAEPTCWRPFSDGQGEATLKPDAFVRYEVGDDEVSAFVEVDCATESPRTIGVKLDAYRRHFLSDVEQAAHGVYPEVLWLTPTVARQRVIERVIVGHPEDSRVLHRVRLYADARAALIEPP